MIRLARSATLVRFECAYDPLFSATHASCTNTSHYGGVEFKPQLHVCRQGKVRAITLPVTGTVIS
jgi:hypothetical protein